MDLYKTVKRLEDFYDSEGYLISKPRLVLAMLLDAYTEVVNIEKKKLTKKFGKKVLH